MTENLKIVKHHTGRMETRTKFIYVNASSSGMYFLLPLKACSDCVCENILHYTSTFKYVYISVRHVHYIPVSFILGHI